jgi:2-C-methyl-D-erythritol 2,4-cyclodiphosphate synthase
MSQDPVAYRVGIGTDLHRIERGGPLRLGGVEVDFDSHLAGHSDGDVVLHAVVDALLGAAGLPDIGERFGDDDPSFKGADSAKLVGQVVADLTGRGWKVGNVDLVIHAERPKLSVYKEAMRCRIAALLRVLPAAVGIKAKTHEGTDAIGRGEAMACTCVVGLMTIDR